MTRNVKYTYNSSNRILKQRNQIRLSWQLLEVGEQLLISREIQLLHFHTEFNKQGVLARKIV